MRVRFSSSAQVFLLSCCAASIAAQSKPASQPNHEAAIREWLTVADHDDAKRRVAVETTLAGGKSALRHLGAIARRGGSDDDTKRRLEILLRDVALGFLDRERTSGMFYAGQYEALAPLQPSVGRIYLQLVIETPDWFPDNLRVAVIPALRDLFPEAPAEAHREELHSIAIDEEEEPSDLRWALACALAEWGDLSLVRPRFEELEDSAGERKSSDELYFVRQIAFLHYQIRDYRKAAAAWLEYLRGSEAIDSPPPPADYYNAACSLSLSGRIRDALDELDRCAAQQVSDRVDESLRLERKLFDHDPELRAVRPTKRFQHIVKTAFPDGKESR